MRKRDKALFTYSLNPLQDDIYVSIGYISNFVGLCTVRLHKILKDMEYKYQGKRKVYPFGKTILFLLEYHTFKYSKNLTFNGMKIRELQRKNK